MNRVKLVLPGEPQGKGRPRFASRTCKDGRTFTQAYTPEATSRYERHVQAVYKAKYGGTMVFPGKEQVAMLVIAYCGIPKSASKRDRELMLSGVIRPAKKPDWDNIGKIISDALNKVAYHDDAQLCDVHVIKRFDNSPRVEVTLIPTYLLDEQAKALKRLEDAQCKLEL